MANNKFDIKNINRRDALVGLLILIVLGVIVYMFAKPSVPKQTITLPTIAPEQKVEQKFNVQIPDNIEKAQLTDVSGGTGSGVATRSEILADLPDPEPTKFYQAWLEKDGKMVSLGQMRIEKGGWLITYNSAKFPGYNHVIVSLETRFDSNIETKVLEGNF